MKKLLTISLLFIGMMPTIAQTEGGTGYAAVQPQEVRPVRLGFLARPALTWLTAENSELDSKGVRMGFSFGLMIDLMIAQNPNYAFSTGLLMNLADGGRLRYADLRNLSSGDTLQQGITNVSHNYQWLEIPLTLKLKTNQIGYMTYFGQLGLQGGVKLSAKRSGDFEFNSGIEDPRLIDKENINNSTRLFNAGLLVGIGAEYNISGNTNILFGISYYRGFTNVLKGNVYDTNRDGKLILEPNEGPDGNTIFVGKPGAKRRAVLSNISLNLGVIF